MKARYYFLSIIVVLVCWGVSLAQSSEPSPGKPRVIVQSESPSPKVDNRTNDNKEKTKNLAIAHKQPSTNTGDKASNTDAGEKDEQKNLLRWTTYATIALAVFAFFQVLAMIFQYWAMRQQIKELRKSINIAKESSDATKDAVDAAKISAESAKRSADSLPRVERAYVFVEVKGSVGREEIDDGIYGTAIGGPKNYKHIVIAAKFFNHGRTPAVIEKFLIYAPVVIVEPTDPFKDSSMTTKMPKGKVIPSGDAVLSNFPIITKDDEWQEVKSGKKRQLCIGIITYKDVFGDIHETGFCWQWVEGLDSFLATDSEKLNYRT